jgi:hypothetical protein
MCLYHISLARSCNHSSIHELQGGNTLRLVDGFWGIFICKSLRGLYNQVTPSWACVVKEGDWNHGFLFKGGAYLPPVRGVIEKLELYF